MGNCSSSSEPSTPSESSAQHLIVFAHGLTASATAAHPAHGRALEELLQDSPSEAVALHFSRSNAGGSGASTFLHTCTVGLKKGGELLAAEVAQVAATMPALTHISLIGASLGGLFARHASALLWGGAAPLLPAHVHPHALVTLASPHLGVRCTPANGPMLKAASCMARTVQDLNWTDGSFGSTPSLVYMGREEAVHVLTLFKHRVAYAPLVDDKVVCWSTAAFSGQPSPSHDTHTAVGCAREVCSQRAAEWVGEQCYFTGDALEEQMRAAAVAVLSAGWTVVDVNMPHKQLATLYPYRKSRQGEAVRNEPNVQVAADVLKRILDVSIEPAEAEHGAKL